MPNALTVTPAMSPLYYDVSRSRGTVFARLCVSLLDPSIAATLTRLVKIAIAFVYLSGDSLRCALLRLVGYRAHAPLIVLMYHAVKSHEREQFARQMDLLARVAEPVSADAPGGAVASRRAVAVTFDDGYQSVLANAVPILRERHIPFTMFVPTKCLGSRPDWITSERHPNAHERLLTSDELKFVQRSGGRIGSHSVTHRRLTELNDAEAFAELSESRAVLQQILQTKVDLFALPYGASNDDVLRLAKQAGYERVFLSVPTESADHVDGLLRGRIDVSPSDWSVEYRLKILGAYSWLPLAIAAKRRLMSVLQKARIHAR